MFRLKTIIFPVALIVLTLTGCELFETRTPDEPEGQTEWNYFPITPEQTLKNLKDAHNYNANADKYGTILAENFRFYFDVQDVRDYSLPAYWGKQEEVHTRNLINISINVELSEIEDEDDIIQADRAVYNRNYSIRKQGSDIVLFSGSLTVEIRREGDGFWKIHRWEDYRTDNEDTWGRLKNEFAP